MNFIPNWNSENALAKCCTHSPLDVLPAELARCSEVYLRTHQWIQRWREIYVTVKREPMSKCFQSLKKISRLNRSLGITMPQHVNKYEVIIIFVVVTSIYSHSTQIECPVLHLSSLSLYLAQEQEMIQKDFYLLFIY